MENKKQEMWWIPRRDWEILEALKDKRLTALAQMAWGTYIPPEPREDQNVKYAWVMIKGERKMIGVDNKTMVGYAMGPNKEKGGPEEWVLPLEILQYDEFIRWCTTFDL